jgi:hypothetical protein
MKGIAGIRVTAMATARILKVLNGPKDPIRGVRMIGSTKPPAAVPTEQSSLNQNIVKEEK